jgi:hypothetical protein
MGFSLFYLNPSMRLKLISPNLLLILLAIITAALYGFMFSIPFPLDRFYNTIPPVDYAKLTHRSLNGSLIYFLGITATFGLYFAALKVVWPKKIVSFWVIGVTAVMLVSSLILSYPVTAIDMFVYALHARGLALYGLNPLASPSNLMPATDPWRGLAGEWGKVPSPYGTVWEGLALLMAYLSGGEFLKLLIALKLLVILAYLGCLWLIYLILQRHQPDWVAVGMVAFAWNPLVLLETAQNGHNDLVMTFFLLLAVYSSYRAHESPHRLFYWLTCVALALSILVKFITLLIVPFFLLALIHKIDSKITRLATILGYGSFIVIFVIIAMLPLWPGWANWAVLRASGQGGYSLLGVLVLSQKVAFGGNQPFDVTHWVINPLFAVIYLYQLARALRPTDSPWLLMITLSFQTLFWYVVLVIPIFHAWYLLWFLPLISLLLPHSAFFKATIIFSFTATLVIPFFETWRAWYPDIFSSYLLIIRLIALFCLIGLPALALIRPSRQYELK